MRFALAAAAMMITLGAAEARTWRIAPGPEAQSELQNALSHAEPRDTVRLERGRYELTRGLTLAIRAVELRGEGQDRTILSFTGQQDRAAGLTVTGPGVVLRDFAVEDAHGDAIVARGCAGVTMQAVRAEWTRGPRSETGGYGLHAVNCSNVLIENAIARGASVAGIGVSGSRNIVARRNVVERNTAGIAIENSSQADVFENTAQHNAGGLVVINLPDQPQSDGQAVRMFGNRLTDNNALNAAAQGAFGFVPSGVGVLVMAGRDVHVFDNDIGGHGAANVLITAYRDTFHDATYSPLPRNVMVRDNRFGAAGMSPAGEWAALGVTPSDVLWDGANTYFAANGPRSDIVRIVMRDNHAAAGGIGTFLSLGLNVAGAPLSEAAPDRSYPPLLDIEEPERVRLED